MIASNGGEVEDLYAVLGVAPDASIEEIEAATKALRWSLHPDRNMDAPEATRKLNERHLQRVNAAFDVLSSPSERASYNSKRTRPADAEVTPSIIVAPAEVTIRHDDLVSTGVRISADVDISGLSAVTLESLEPECLESGMDFGDLQKRALFPDRQFPARVSFVARGWPSGEGFVVSYSVGSLSAQQTVRVHGKPRNRPMPEPVPPAPTPSDQEWLRPVLNWLLAVLGLVCLVASFAISEWFLALLLIVVALGGVRLLIYKAKRAWSATPAGEQLGMVDSMFVDLDPTKLTLLTLGLPLVWLFVWGWVGVSFVTWFSRIPGSMRWSLNAVAALVYIPLGPLFAFQAILSDPFLPAFDALPTFAVVWLIPGFFWPVHLCALIYFAVRAHAAIQGEDW
jgi:curved DNA-binding protein CbpA